MATYIVQKGDCLWSIAKSQLGAGSKWKDIADANTEVTKPPNYIIHPGDKLEIPGSSGPGTSADAPANNSNAPTIEYFGFVAGDDLEMLIAWNWKNLNDTKEFRIVWSYYLNGRWFIGQDQTQSYDKELDGDGSQRLFTFKPPENADKVKVKIKPIAKTKKTNGNTETAIFTADWSNEKDATKDLSDAPPRKPSSPPTPTVKAYKLTVTATGLTELNATHIEFGIMKIVKDNTTGDITEFNTDTGAVAKISQTGDVSYTCDVDAGCKYKCRCRSHRGNQEPSEWTDWSDAVETIPAVPSGFTVCRALFDSKTREHGVHLEWPTSLTADEYVIEYATKKEYFDFSTKVSEETVPVSETDNETKTFDLYDLNPGLEYFFRLRAVKNSEKTSPSGLSSVRLGEKPAAPTTWSSTTRAIVGEPLRFYWVHNTVDGSEETSAELRLTINGSTTTKKIDKGQNEETTSFYELDTSNNSDLTFNAGAEIKWAVRTQGILTSSDMWSDWSTERTVDLYAKPRLDMNVSQVENGESTNNITSFPFYIYAQATPETQTPIGYHVSIVSNNDYETVDELGNTRIMIKGSEVYSKHFDDSDVTWAFNLKLTASDVSLENNVKYTAICTVTMDSGLTAKATSEFTVYWSDGMYVPNAEMGVNKEALTAYIRPYLDIPGRNLLMYDASLSADSNAVTGGHWICNDDPPPTQGVEIGFKCKKISMSVSGGTTVTAQAMLRGSANINFYFLMSKPGSKYNMNFRAAEKADLDSDEYRYFAQTYTIPEGYTLDAFYIVTVYGETFARDWFELKPGSAKLEIGSEATAWSAAPEDDGFTGTTLSVYRREFDGTFTEIATGIDDSKNTFVIDPHPSLDFARYRIVATSNSTGAIGYYDMPGYPIEEQAIVIQWAEEWISFDAVGEDQMENRPWSGSLLKLPYNISVSDKTSPDVSNIKYIGRKHPVAYYGTHVGQTSSWSTVIPKDDIETLYALRRLSMWMGDVYVREPSGIGYWANLRVSLSQKHNDLTIPVSFEITRIEGGM